MSSIHETLDDHFNPRIHVPEGTIYFDPQHISDVTAYFQYEFQALQTIVSEDVHVIAERQRRMDERNEELNHLTALGKLVTRFQYWRRKEDLNTKPYEEHRNEVLRKRNSVLDILAQVREGIGTKALWFLRERTSEDQQRVEELFTTGELSDEENEWLYQASREARWTFSVYAMVDPDAAEKIFNANQNYATFLSLLEPSSAIQESIPDGP